MSITCPLVNYVSTTCPLRVHYVSTCLYYRSYRYPIRWPHSKNWTWPTAGRRGETRAVSNARTPADSLLTLTPHSLTLVPVRIQDEGDRTRSRRCVQHRVPSEKGYRKTVLINICFWTTLQYSKFKVQCVIFSRLVNEVCTRAYGPTPNGRIETYIETRLSLSY